MLARREEALRSWKFIFISVPLIRSNPHRAVWNNAEANCTNRTFDFKNGNSFKSQSINRMPMTFDIHCVIWPQWPDIHVVEATVCWTCETHPQIRITSIAMTPTIITFVKPIPMKIFQIGISHQNSFGFVWLSRWNRKWTQASTRKKNWWKQNHNQVIFLFGLEIDRRFGQWPLIIDDLSVVTIDDRWAYLSIPNRFFCHRLNGSFESTHFCVCFCQCVRLKVSSNSARPNRWIVSLILNRFVPKRKEKKWKRKNKIVHFHATQSIDWIISAKCWLSTIDLITENLTERMDESCAEVAPATHHLYWTGQLNISNSFASHLLINWHENL